MAASPNMAFIAGGRLEFPNHPDISLEIAGLSRDVAPFLIDQYPVTVREVREVFPSLTGLDEQLPDDPAHSLPWDVAVAYAEAVGKQLPSVWEMAFVVTNGGTTRFPWGDTDFEATSFVEQDKTPYDPAVHRLLSGPAVWTDSPARTLVKVYETDGTHDLKVPGDPSRRYAFGLSENDRKNIQTSLRNGGVVFFRHDSSISSKSPVIGLRLVRRLPR